MALAASSVEGRPLPRYRLLTAVFMHALGEPGAESMMRDVIDDLIVGEPRWAAAGLGHLAALEATQGRGTQSTQTLSRALTLARGMDSRAIRAALDWASAVVEVCGAPGSTRTFRAPSRALWSRVLEAIFPRVLEQRVRDQPVRPARRALSIDARGASFTTSSGETVYLGRRHSMRRLLAALVIARKHGAWVSPADALAAAWPGDRSRPAALRNRLRVAVATLRRLGLGDALEGSRLGYRLDPAIDVEILEISPEASAQITTS